MASPSYFRRYSHRCAQLRPRMAPTTRSLLAALVVLRAADAAAVDLKSRAGTAAAAPASAETKTTARNADAADECSLRNWPGVQPSWRHGGASELCFCAYAGGAELDSACPRWKAVSYTHLTLPTILLV